MNTLSFMGANFVARQNGYKPTPSWGWGDYERQVQEYFRPLETFERRAA